MSSSLSSWVSDFIFPSKFNYVSWLMHTSTAFTAAPEKSLKVKILWLWIVSKARTRVMKFHCPTIYHSIRQHLWSDNYRDDAPVQDQLKWLLVLPSCACCPIHILTTTIHYWFEKNDALLENHSHTHFLWCFAHYFRL